MPQLQNNYFAEHISEVASKKKGENFETYLTHFQPMFHLNPLIPTEKMIFSDIFWKHRRGALVENVLTQMFYPYYKKWLVIGLVQPYL